MQWLKSFFSTVWNFNSLWKVIETWSWVSSKLGGIDKNQSYIYIVYFEWNYKGINEPITVKEKEIEKKVS